MPNHGITSELLLILLPAWKFFVKIVMLRSTIALYLCHFIYNLSHWFPAGKVTKETVYHNLFPHGASEPTGSYEITIFWHNCTYFECAGQRVGI